MFTVVSSFFPLRFIFIYFIYFYCVSVGTSHKHVHTGAYEADGMGQGLQAV